MSDVFYINNLRINTQPGERADLGDTQAVLIEMEANDRLLADIDTYVDWLSRQCTGAKPEHCHTTWVPNDELKLERVMASLDVPQLVSLTFYPRVQVQVAALDLLKQKYIEQSGDYLSILRAKVQAEYES